MAATGTDSPKRLNRKGPFGARIHTPIIMPRHPNNNGLTRDPLITLLMMQARGTAVYKRGLTAFEPGARARQQGVFRFLRGWGAVLEASVALSPPGATRQR